jgi:hypothetical protein
MTYSAKEKETLSFFAVIVGTTVVIVVIVCVLLFAVFDVQSSSSGNKVGASISPSAGSSSSIAAESSSSSMLAESSTGGTLSSSSSSSFSSSSAVPSEVIGTNNVALATGSIVWNVNTVGSFVVGDVVQITWTGDSGDYFQGVVTAVNANAPTITVDATSTTGQTGIQWTPWLFTLLSGPVVTVSSSSSSPVVHSSSSSSVNTGPGSTSIWQNAFASSEGSAYADNDGFIWQPLTACGTLTLSAFMFNDYAIPSANGPFRVTPVTSWQLVQYARNGSTTSCSFTSVSPGTYLVSLLMLSGDSGPLTSGYRAYSININGVVAAANYDILAITGGYFQCSVATYPTTVTGSGNVTINFAQGSQAGASVLLAGVQIVPSTADNDWTVQYPKVTPISTTSVFMAASVSLGSTAFDNKGNTWSGVSACSPVQYQYSSPEDPTGEGITATNSFLWSVTTTSNDGATIACVFGLANRAYNISLYQTETGSTTRNTNVTLNNIAWLTNWNVATQSGGVLKPLVTVYPNFQVTNNVLSLNLTSAAEFTAISIVSS